LGGTAKPLAASAMIRSPKRMEPPSGARNPAMRLSIVVLPHPDAPSTAVISPSRNSTLMSRTAALVPKFLRSLSKRTLAIRRLPRAFEGAFAGARCPILRGVAGRGPEHLEAQLQGAAPFFAREPLRRVGIAALDRSVEARAIGRRLLGAPR